MKDQYASATEGLISFLKTTMIFKEVPEALLEKIASLGHIVKYGAGQIIWCAGQKAESFTIIKHGIVQAVRNNTSGDPSIIALFGAKELIGLPALISKGSYPATAMPLSGDVEIVHIDFAKAMKILQSEPSFQNTIGRAMVEAHYALHRKVDVMNAGSVHERLKALFQMLSERFGDEAEDGQVVIPLPLTRLQISTLIGARIETVIRELSTWQKRKVLTSSSRGFTVCAKFLTVSTQHLQLLKSSV